MEVDRNGRDPKTLLIRHLPERMNKEERIEFCKYYGAQNAAAMSDRGKMKYCAFAYFADHLSASQALHKLHQLSIYGRTLTVEYARKNASLRHKTEHELNSEKQTGKHPPSEKGTSDAAERLRKEEQALMEGPISLSTLSERLGLKYPLNPALKYTYPRPTQQVIMNIANALASVPQFYTQVLHLMNKMNLPAPFTLASFPAPPLPQEEETQLPPEPEEMEMSSEEESEMESDEENKDQKRPKDAIPLKRPVKRRTVKTKRPRIDQLLAAGKAAQNVEAIGAAIRPSHIFEEQQVTVKKPEIRLSEGIAAALSKQAEAETGQSEDVTGGFGTFTPAAPPTDRQDEEEGDSSDDGIESADFIKREQLKNRISRDDMKRMSVYKSYNPGEPNTRLYIKNLSKQVEEKDLKFIYGRYLDWTSTLDKDMFSIQLMKQGRMKGQAFIGLPSEYAAKKALKETNGYLLQGKPLVVVYARSAKPKPEQEGKKGQKT